MRRLGGFLALLIALVAMTSPARAERYALLIGNQAYNDSVGPLRNPRRDIAVVARALAEVDFKVLPLRVDATRDEILFAVYELAAKVRAAGRDAVSFLYYAGHGVGVGGENLLIPVNAENTTDAMLSVRGVRLGEILDILKRDAPDAAHFVVLDACRTMRGRRGERGFVPVNDRRTGVVVAFSTAPGETATDEGANGAPYALALAEEIVKPGRTDQAVFNAVRTRVVATASGQTPWTNDGLIGDRVVFKAVPPDAARTSAVPPPAPAAQPSEAALEWARVDRTSLAELETFRRRHPGSVEAEYAFAHIAELQRLEDARKPGTVATLSGPPEPINGGPSNGGAAPAGPTDPELAQLAGIWKGAYFYPNASKKPVDFLLNLQVYGNVCRGRTEEPNTLSNDRNSPKLFANVDCGRVPGAAPQRLVLRKVYDGTGGQHHAVDYEGDVSSDGRSIVGTWKIGTTTGRFMLNRQ